MQWNALPSFLDVPLGVSAKRAQGIRKAITMALERIDHLHRHLFAQKSAHRVCLQKFRHDGILLPFGFLRQPFVVPNPYVKYVHAIAQKIVLTQNSTFFQSGVWLIKDSADPLAGWLFPDVLSIPSGPIANDLYGQLHAYIQERLAIVQKRLCSQPLKFTFTSIDATICLNSLKLAFHVSRSVASFHLEWYLHHRISAK